MIPSQQPIKLDVCKNIALKSIKHFELRVWRVGVLDHLLGNLISYSILFIYSIGFSHIHDEGRPVFVHPILFSAVLKDHWLPKQEYLGCRYILFPKPPMFFLSLVQADSQWACSTRAYWLLFGCHLKSLPSEQQEMVSNSIPKAKMEAHVSL